MERIKLILAAALMMALAGCVSATPSTQPDEATIAKGHPAILAYAAAFNARDADAMGALLHPDFEWLNITPEGIETVSTGREALLAEMRVSFAGNLSTTSTLSDWSLHGAYTSVVETASWTGKDGTPRSQSSLSVYETTPEGLLRRVWYFPVVK